MNLPLKGAGHTLYNGPPDKGGIIQWAGCLIRKKGCTTYGPCLIFDVS